MGVNYCGEVLSSVEVFQEPKVGATLIFTPVLS